MAFTNKWALENSLGGNVLLNTIPLLEGINISSNSKVLDLGSGLAVTSIYLAREYGCQVWSVDKYIDPTLPFLNAKKFSLDNLVFPLKLDANCLPFAYDFFDIIVCVNSYSYFGTDDKFLPYVSRFLKSEGIFLLSDLSFSESINDESDIPNFLKHTFYDYWSHIHTLDYWISKFQLSGLYSSIEGAVLDNSISIKDDYINNSIFKDDAFSRAFILDDNQFINYFKLVAVKNDRKPFFENYSDDGKPSKP